MRSAGVPPVLDVDIRRRDFTSAGGTTLTVVQDLQFTLEANTFTCIVGPSGCGKTTTLRMILGLDRGFDGQVTHHRQGPMAAVFQEPRLLPWRTVDDNVRIALPKTADTSDLDRLFDELDLTPVRHFYPSELSLGLARRAALARAFALQPELLILDEPFVSLDESIASRLRDVLVNLWHSRPTTALMVTHNLREAANLADRILVFSDRPARIVDELTLEVPRGGREERFLAGVESRLRRWQSSGD